MGRIQNVAVTTLEKFRSGVRRRRNLAPRSLPDNDVRFIDPMYNELFRVPDGGVVQMTYPDGHQRSEVVEHGIWNTTIISPFRRTATHGSMLFIRVIAACWSAEKLTRPN